MRFKLFTFLLICLFSFSVNIYSQQEGGTKNAGINNFLITLDDNEEVEIVEKLRNMPNIEVGKGVTFMPKDKWFKMTMRFRMQNMVGFHFNDDFNLKKTEAQVKRLRLRFDGYIYSPKIQYTIQLGFTPYDAKMVPDEKMNIVRDAMVYYVPNSTWNIGFGQTKIKANRARINSSSALQFVDRSIVNSEFNIDRDFGFFGEYNSDFKRKFQLVARGSITSGDGRNFQTTEDAGFAYTGRLELFPMGRFKSLGEISEGDFHREETPKILIGGAFSYNNKARRLRGQTGDIIDFDDKRDLSSYYLDFILKYRGYAFYVDWMGRLCDDPVIKSPEGDYAQYIFAGNGINVQTSYLFKSNWEIALRNSILLPKDKVKPYTKYYSNNQATVGVTRYIIGHNLKVQADASYNYRNGMSSSKYNRYEIRFQVELGF